MNYNNLSISRKIVLLNCQGLSSSKLDIMRDFLFKHRPLVVILQEIHLAPSRELNLSFRNYRSYCFPLTSHSSGTLILINNQVTGSELNPLIRGLNLPTVSNSYSLPNSTAQWCSIKFRIQGYTKDIVLIPVYIPPASSTNINNNTAISLLFQDIDSMLTSLNSQASSNSSTFPNIIVCGDFNSHHADTGDKMALINGTSSLAELLFDSFYDRNFVCLNSLPSIRGQSTHNSGSTLDLFFEFNDSAFVNHQLINTLEFVDQIHILSDHSPVIACLELSSLSSPLPAPHHKWNTDNASVDQISSFTRLMENMCDAQLSDNDTSGKYQLSTEFLVNRNALADFRINPSDQVNLYYQNKALPVANKLLDTLIRIINYCATISIGTLAVSKVNKREWTKEVRTAFHQYVKLRRKLKNNFSNVDLSLQCSEAYNHFASLLQQSKGEQWEEIGRSIEEENSKGNKKLLWSAFKKVSNTKQKATFVSGGIKDPDNNNAPTTTLNSSIRVLEKHFKNQLSPHVSLINNSNNNNHHLAISQTLEDELLNSFPTSNIPFKDTINDNFISSEIIHTLFSKCNLRTAAGPDGINGHLIRWSIESKSFLSCVTALFNFCIHFHILPDDWKKADLTLIHKKGKPEDECDSFRPISITSLFIRLFEKLMIDKFRIIIDPLLNKWQSGFRQKRNTKHQILSLQCLINAALTHSNCYFPVIFLDIKRAFDSVPHEALIFKLLKMGVKGDLLHFIKSFLTNRSFRIIHHNIDKTQSEWIPAVAGVPQGSVLAPLLYCVFINDLFPPNPLAFIKAPGQLLFADDIAIVPPLSTTSSLPDVRLKQITDHLHDQLNHIGNWANLWGVRFSPNKSGCVWFSNPSKMRTLATPKCQFIIPYDAVNTTCIPNVSDYQYLGVWFNNNLSSSTHIKHLIKKANFTSNIISSIINYNQNKPGFKVIRQLTNSILLPQIEYSLPFIFPTNKDFAALNRIYFRPLQKFFRIPNSVHRAGFAVYVNNPIIQIHREKSLLSLLSNILSLRFSCNNTQPLTSFPVFSFAAHLVQKKDNALINLSHPRPSAYYKFKPLPLYYASVISRWKLSNSFPSTTSLLSVSNNNDISNSSNINNNNIVTSLRKIIKTESQYQSIAHWLNECSGLPSYINYNKRAITTTKGNFLPQFYNIDLSTIHTSSDINTNALNLINGSSNAFPYPTLLSHNRDDSVRHSHLLLNRSHLNSVRSTHDNQGVVSPFCTQCPTVLVPETVLHTISNCSAYALKRSFLASKLHDFIRKLKLHCRNDLSLNFIAHSYDSLFLHIILNNLLNSKIFKLADRKFISEYSNYFLEYIASIRPL
jgi:exonuclease III